LFVTKDEPAHSKYCSSGEHWLHAMLFILHPLVLLSAGLLWPVWGKQSLSFIQYTGFERELLLANTLLTLAFGLYQLILLELLMALGHITKTGQVNNAIYRQLGDRWYTAQDDPIALLRAESRARNPWIASNIRRAFPSGGVKVLDIGCGGGFLSNYLANAGFTVTGLDASAESIVIAQRYDTTGHAYYVVGDAYDLPYADGEFQAACAMDFLEHVDEPQRVLAEAARTLQPGGILFFATFNRNFISWLFGIKGVEWFVRNTPPRLHELSHFIKPAELRAMCEENGLRVNELRGFAPQFN
jgi:2-polyprenyl-6-hydroxyphenyl methylase/3-demethylubiquinone-9 3-methyltransferase